MNDELFDSVTLRGLVNILCHELGHIADKFRVPMPASKGNLKEVIDFEKAANDIGIEMFAKYYPREDYWCNHEDLDRMKGSLKHYDLTPGYVHKPGLPSCFYEKVRMAAIV